MPLGVAERGETNRRRGPRRDSIRGTAPWRKPCRPPVGVVRLRSEGVMGAGRTARAFDAPARGAADTRPANERASSAVEANHATRRGRRRPPDLVASPRVWSFLVRRRSGDRSELPRHGVPPAMPRHPVTLTPRTSASANGPPGRAGTIPGRPVTPPVPPPATVLIPLSPVTASPRTVVTYSPKSSP